MSAHRLSRIALLTAVALIIFIVELQIPSPIPFPGVKLGLANVVTLYAFFAYGPKDTACILLARILLGCTFSGQVIALLYSLAGGFLCFAVTFFLSKIVSEKQIWVCGVFGAIAHIIGQMIVAVLLTGTLTIISYLALLLLSAIITGLLTGFCSQITYIKLKKMGMTDTR